jgi:hypothetical protein
MALMVLFALLQPRGQCGEKRKGHKCAHKPKYRLPRVLSDKHVETRTAAVQAERDEVSEIRGLSWQPFVTRLTHHLIIVGIRAEDDPREDDAIFLQ